VEDIILYYYAKLVITPSAGFKGNYRFIIDSYKRLKSGEIRISDYERELLHLASMPNICAFCGSLCTEYQTTHIVPRSLGVPPGMHNIINACKACFASKGEKDLVEWWLKDLKRRRDDLPRVPLGLYLKIAYELHKINFSLRKPCRSLGELFEIFKKR
jgi:5-methylcytosine-specific restriction endonuclease McrA